MKCINIDLNAPFITQRCASNILRTIIELLLYNRGQTPFLYRTFRTMIKNREQRDAGGPEEYAFSNMKSQKRRDQAQEVIQSIELIFDTINRILIDDASVRELMFLFGKTIYTAKEAFVVQLPDIDVNHYDRNHHQAVESIIRTVGMKLTLSPAIFEEQGVLVTTNMFVLVRTSITPEGVGVELLNDYQLPKKCSEVIINLFLTDMEEGSNFMCCEHLKVYDDQMGSPGVSVTSGVAANETPINNWCLLDTVVKGFKIDFAKDKNMWN